MKSVHKKRVFALRTLMRDQKLDGFYVRGETSLRHLLGRANADDRVLVLPRSIVLFQDSRSASVRDSDIRVLPLARSDYAIDLQKTLKKVRVLGVDAGETTVVQLQKLRSVLRGSGVRVRPILDPLQGTRRKKSQDDIENHRRAAHIADLALTATRKNARLGMTETDLAWMLEQEMRQRGADQMAFPPIAAFAENAATPHHGPSSKRKLKKGDLVLLDFGAVVEGCRSDMSRTFLPAASSKKMQSAYRAVGQSQAAGLRALASDVSCEHIDDVCRGVLREHNFESYFTHATGHGVGLDIHESPSLSCGSKDILAEGMIVTVEPGVYIPNTFGIRIEDMVAITKNGHERLTQSCRRLKPFLSS